MTTDYLSDLRDYYRDKAHAYASTYTGEGRYRSNHFRLQIVRKLLADITPRPGLVIEAGCGDGRVVAALCDDGFSCRGFDHSPEMIGLGKELLAGQGIDPAVIRQGDIYAPPVEDHSADAVVCLGALEILPDHERIFREFRRILQPGGQIVVSLGNDLFSLFSMNRHTVKFYARLLEDIGAPKKAIADLESQQASWLNLDDVKSAATPMSSSEILSKASDIPSYNPLNIAGALAGFGFTMDALRFYHYHPLPPRMEAAYPELFRNLAEGLESDAYDWRGGVLCNAMVMRARLT